MVQTKTGGIGGVVVAVALMSVAYIVGRWQINRAGDIIDDNFAAHPRAVLGLTALGSALFGQNVVPNHPLVPVMAGAGLLLIGEDALSSAGSQYVEKADPIDLNGNDPPSIT